MENWIFLVAFIGLGFYIFGKKEKTEEKKEVKRKNEVKTARIPTIFGDLLSKEPLLPNETVWLELPTNKGSIVAEVNESTRELYYKHGMSAFQTYKKSNYPNMSYKVKKFGWGRSFDNDYVYYDDSEFCCEFGYYPQEFLEEMIIDAVDSFIREEIREEYELRTGESRAEVIEPEIIEDVRCEPEYPEERSRGIFDPDSETHKVSESSCDYSRTETPQKEEVTYHSEPQRSYSEPDHSYSEPSSCDTGDCTGD